jgi:prepilin-type N-terminal cleavage/methylation domain-containing protein
MRLAAQRSGRNNRGFTLVEILIVVIILGILATIIIGLFSNATKDASTGALRDNLRSVRSALQIYMAQHGSYPATNTFEQQMTQFSDSTGATSATRTATHVHGPYILALPTLPVGTEKGNTGVTTMTYTAGYGWSYDPTTGAFRANTRDSEVDGDGVAYNTY